MSVYYYIYREVWARLYARWALIRALMSGNALANVEHTAWITHIKRAEVRRRDREQSRKAHHVQAKQKPNMKNVQKTESNQ